jgi:long-chain acyl-CoA synthetase
MNSQYTNLSELLSTSVERFADNPLFGVRVEKDSWRWTTYRTFGEDVARARASLASMGVEAGDRVAFIADNGVPWAVVAYGAYTLGALFVPMYEKQQDADWKHITSDCGAKVLFAANDRILERIDAFRSDIPTVESIVVIDPEHGPNFDAFLELGADTPVDPTHPGSDDIAGFIYTSGTTGQPKGVMLSHGNITSNVNAINEVFPLDPSDRSASFLPWSHAFGQTVELHTLISMGASTAITNAKTLVRDMPEVKPTILVAVPTMFNRMYDGISKFVEGQGGLIKTVFTAAMTNEARRKEMAARGVTTRWVELKHRVFDRLVFSLIRGGMGGRLKYAFTGGAAISEQVADFISAIGVTVYEGYGLSETSPVVSANTREARLVGSVGRAIPGVTIRIDAAVTDEDDVGEIVVYGPNVMTGYYNLPEKTAEAVDPDGGFRTGDLGHVDEAGFLHIRGRIKEQYKLSNGKYVVPSPIEEQLQLSGFIQNVMIYGEQRSYNVAVIVPDMKAVNKWAEAEGLDTADREQLLASSEAQHLFAAELKRFGEPVKHYERPKGFVIEPEEWTPENGFLTPSLKVKRRIVLSTYADDIAAIYDNT